MVVQHQCVWTIIFINTVETSKYSNLSFFDSSLASY